MLELSGISMIGAAVEFSWAAGESVLVPFLTRHGVPDWLVSTIYLANPTVGLYVQPKIGAWSDRLNRRIPFVLGLTAAATLGVLTLLLAVPITDLLNVGGKVTIAAAFVGFGFADISFDCLLIPGRALLDDHTQDGMGNKANSLFTGFQLCGRLAALLLGASSWTVTGLGGIFRGMDAHFNSMFSLSAAFMLVSTTIACLSASETSHNNNAALFETEEQQELATEEGLEQSSSDVPKLSVNPDLDLDSDVPLLGTAEEPQAMPDSRNTVCCGYRISLTRGEWFLCIIQAVGWLGICSQAFFWTTWRGEVQGCADLAAQSIVGIITASILPFANKKYSTVVVWCLSELSFCLLMMSTAVVANDSIIAMIIGALSGINYAIHATNALLVAADIAEDPSQRASTIAKVNNTLPVGQLLTAILGGIIAEILGGFQWVFVLSLIHI